MDAIPYGYCKCGCGAKTNIRNGAYLSVGQAEVPCDYLKGHNRRRPPTPERFWSMVDKRSRDECWLWKGSKSSGYGVFWLGSYLEKRVMKAHAFAASLEYGPLPEGLQVNHHCDVRACCNPHHLYYGTQEDNLRDFKARGHRRVHKIYSDEEAMEVIELLEVGVSAAAIARRVRMSVANVYSIKYEQSRRPVWLRFRSRMNAS